MPLVKETIDIPLAAGVDTKSDPKQTRRLLRLDNAYVERPGEVRRRKTSRRLPATTATWGKDSYTGTVGVVRDIHGVNSINGALIAMAENAVEAGVLPTGSYPNLGVQPLYYSPGAGAWLREGYTSVHPLAYTVQRLGHTANAANPSLAVGKGMVFAACDADAWIGDNETRASLTGWDTLAGVTNGLSGAPKPIFLGGKFLAYATNSGSTNLIRCKWNPSAPQTKGTNTAQYTDMGTGGIWDFCKVNDSVAALVYLNNSGNLLLKRLDPDGTELTAHTVDTGHTIYAVGIFVAKTSAGATRLFIAFAEGASNFRVAVWDDAGTEIVAPTVVTTAMTSSAVVRITGAQQKWPSEDYVQIFAEVDAASNYLNRLRVFDCKFDCSSVQFETDVRHVGLASKAFTYNGHTYVLATHDSTEQPTYFLLSVEKERPATDGYPQFHARVLLNRAGGLRTRVCSLSDVSDLGGGKFSLAALRQERLISDGAIIYAPVQITFDMMADPVRATSLGRSTQTSGGVILGHGDVPTDIGFPLWPEDISAANGAAGNVADGAYQYAVVAEWTDSFGELHRSAPSTPLDHTVTGGPLQVTVTIPTICQISYAKASRVKFYVYRTVAGGAVFYKVTSTGVANSLAADSVTLVDNYADATIQNNEQLYTGGGILDANTAPSAKCLVSRNDRLFAVPFDDDEAVAYTKPKEDAIAPEFNDALFVRISEGGPIEAIAKLDDNIVVFKRRSQYVFGGPGPNALGVGAFSPPRNISTEIGCSEPGSVVSTKEGVFFKSERGIYLLDRSLRSAYVGAPVEAYNSERIVSAAVLGDIEQVRFVTNGGHVLVLDTLHGIWSVYTVDDVVDATAHDGGWCWATRSRIFIEDETAKDDTGGKFALETAWISAAGIGGFQRLWWLHLTGQFAAGVKLRADLMYDHDETVQQSVTLDGSSSAWRIKPKVQKCSAFRLKLTELDGSSGDLRLSMLSLVVGRKAGTRKHPKEGTR